MLAEFRNAILELSEPSASKSSMLYYMSLIVDNEELIDALVTKVRYMAQSKSKRQTMQKKKVGLLGNKHTKDDSMRSSNKRRRLNPLRPSSCDKEEAKVLRIVPRKRKDHTVCYKEVRHHHFQKI